MKYRAIGTAFLAGILAAVLLAGTTDGPDHRYVEYGKQFSKYTARVFLPCDGKTCEATATLIDDHWALTAAHVVGTSTSASIWVNGKPFDVDRVVVHPEFKEGGLGKHDIALLHSLEPFAIDFYPPLSTGEEQAGDIVSICGFGIHGDMASGHSKADGIMRAGTNTIDRIDGHLIVCTASPGRSVLEICIAPGDSGGPLFCRGSLAGVNCLTMADAGPLRSKTGEESGHVRVSLYRDWIESVISGKAVDVR